jgi:hypothetical protein
MYRLIISYCESEIVESEDLDLLRRFIPAHKAKDGENHYALVALIEESAPNNPTYTIREERDAFVLVDWKGSETTFYKI